MFSLNKKKNGKAAAVIDIGSNLIKMRISQLKKGEIIELDRLEYPLGLGHEVFTNGKISFESLRILSQILRGYAEVMEEYGITQYRVVATTALREASNRAYVIDQLKIQNNMTVTVLEDDQEKTLIYSEILCSMAQSEIFRKGNTMISYIGAGTIGFSLFNGENMIYSQNIPIGALKLHDMLDDIEELTENFHVVVEEYLNSVIGHTILPLDNTEIDNLVLTGNEIQLIAKICGSEPKDGIYLISSAQVQNLFNEIRHMSQEKISIKYGIKEDTAELLYSALAIYIRLIRFVRADHIIAPKVELWDALMRQMLAPRAKIEYTEHVRRNAISCAKVFAESFHCNLEHADLVRQFACKIFDKMKGSHGLDLRQELLLELAAILHDCGYNVTSRQHLKSSFDLIKDIDIYGMTDEEMLITAYVVRYNEYEPTRYDDFELMKLTDEQRMIISKLSAIFRLANALDKAQKQKLEDIRVRLDGNKLLISAESDRNLVLEKWTFQQCATFFKEVFGITPELTIKTLMI